MSATYFFCVADFGFSLTLPQDCNLERLLPSFMPFRCAQLAEPLLFEFDATATDLSITDAYTKIDESVNDMGHSRLWQSADGYGLQLRFTARGPVHTMLCDKQFRAVRARVRFDDPYVGEALSSLLRVAFSMAIIPHGAISLHASAVVFDSRAYLFMGKSGTGKSTHASLWLSKFADAFLLNDDNPTVRLRNSEVIAYGTPWSGKTPCYKNLKFPIGGFVRLEQAPENRFERRTDVEAFMLLLPGCSFVRSDTAMMNAVCDTLTSIVAHTPVGHLQCLPNPAAAALCESQLRIEN